MPETSRPRHERFARDLRVPVRVALFLTGREADAVFCNCGQFTAFDRVQHGRPPRNGFLGCGTARFDVAPQARRVRDAQFTDGLPRCVVWSARCDGRAFPGGKALNRQQRGGQACTAGDSAISDHDRERMRHTLLDGP